MNMPAGTYYVGDLCYVLDDDDWDWVCLNSFDPKSGKSIQGMFEMNNGKKFCLFETAYGDGEYNDQFGKSYLVDSGTIGCVLLKYTTKDGMNGGQIIQFNEPFECKKSDKTLIFGPVTINTGDDGLDYDKEVFDD